jgi:hypothetical protein
MDARKVAANAELRRTQLELGVTGRRLPFLCECSDVSCRAVVLLSAEAYELARADGERCIVVDGHPGSGTVVERGDGFVIVQKE